MSQVGSSLVWIVSEPKYDRAKLENSTSRLDFVTVLDTAYIFPPTYSPLKAIQTVFLPRKYSRIIPINSLNFYFTLTRYLT